jgi:hypothetical protein
VGGQEGLHGIGRRSGNCSMRNENIRVAAEGHHTPGANLAASGKDLQGGGVGDHHVRAGSMPDQADNPVRRRDENMDLYVSGGGEAGGNLAHRRLEGRGTIENNIRRRAGPGPGLAGGKARQN